MNKYMTALLLLIVSFFTIAHNDKAHSDKDIQAIITIIDGIKSGWENGDGTPFR
ncbi:hypothetical protein [Colwellia sp. 6M3]|jgi:hypothetical protein|uniref:hypothetical protein n=1 Tax=Colwellia sp. 6M3 TaxID=2759849 RepID=UPI00217547B5|nr:hypothetical protein [Colwellia sp. 6M3]